MMKGQSKSGVTRSIGKMLCLIAMSLHCGCCYDDFQKRNQYTIAFRSNPISTFVDSAGNHLQIIITDTASMSSRQSENYDNRDGCLAYFPVTQGVIHPPSPDHLFRYDQKDHSLKVMDVYIGNYYFVQIPNWIDNLTIQGQYYANCIHFKQTDSLGQVLQELAIDPYYGVVLFAYRDEYRWERVLEW